MNALAKLLRAVNDREPMSLRLRAAKIQNRVSYATIGDYQNGRGAARPDEATLQALADAYGLSLDEVQRAAEVPVGAGPYTPPPEAARLTRRQQAALTELILAMAERLEGASDAGNAEDQKSGDDPEGSGPTGGGGGQPDSPPRITSTTGETRSGEPARDRSVAD